MIKQTSHKINKYWLIHTSLTPKLNINENKGMRNKNLETQGNLGCLTLLANTQVDIGRKQTEQLYDFLKNYKLSILLEIIIITNKNHNHIPHTLVHQADLESRGKLDKDSIKKFPNSKIKRWKKLHIIKIDEMILIRC